MCDIKVMIADDHVLIRQGLKTLLDLSDGIKVVAEAGDGQGAINVCRTESIDVVLMDINMPYVSGVDATRIIKREKPNIGIIALTISENDKDIYDMIQAGISGYFLKDTDADTLIASIKAVATGQTMLHPSITKKVLMGYKGLTAPVYKEKELLTERETEILKLIAHGKSNKEVAATLFISEKTVKNHLTNVYRKIDVQDRTQAVIFAMKNNIE